MIEIAPNTITMEAFEGIIRNLQAFEDQQDQFSDDLDKYVDGWLITTFGTEFMVAVVEGLESCFAHGGTGHDGMISWWLWDAPEAGKNKDSAWIGHGDGTKYALYTIPLLYEYLTTGKTSVVHGEADSGPTLDELVRTQQHNHPAPLSLEEVFEAIHTLRENAGTLVDAVDDPAGPGQRIGDAEDKPHKQ